MPVINWPKAPLPNRVEGEKSPQMVDRGDARMGPNPWYSRLEDTMREKLGFLGGGDPASDAMGLAGPMQLPGALGIGIVKTAGPKALTKVGKWGRGPANEALEYLAKKFPRLTQQVEFLMDDTIGPETSARWRADQYLPSRAASLAEGGERYTAKTGKIGLNPNLHKQGQSADDSVNTIAHELQHATDNLRQPQTYDPAYHNLNINPFAYEMNPYENLANITGAMEQGNFMAGRGKVPDEMLYDWALQMRGRFPEKLKSVIDPFLGKNTEAPMDMLRAARAPNRAIARLSEGSILDKSGDAYAHAKQLDRLNKHLKSPDALRKAILAVKKGR